MADVICGDCAILRDGLKCVRCELYDARREIGRLRLDNDLMLTNRWPKSMSDLQLDNEALLQQRNELLAACRAAFVALPMSKHNEATNAMLKAAIAKAEAK